MKKLYLFFAMLLAFAGSNTLKAIELPTGIFALGNEATTLETGKWYFLLNHGTNRYVKEGSSYALNQTTTSPRGLDASSNAGYLVTLEEATDGKFFIKSGLGNYYKSPGSSARGTGASATSSWAMSITTIDGNPGHFLLQGTTYNMVAPTDGSDIKGGTTKTANSIGDWAFVEVKTEDASELTGRDLYNYQMSRLGLIRLHNKRTSTAYLTSNTSGSAVGASRVASGLSQIWILEKSGNGYTVRSANTGQFLQSTFGSPSSASTTLYIQFSPNNTGTMSYINLSSSSDFSGQTCMNLGNNGTTVTKWSYSNDSGSDWAIELAEDITEDDVRAHLNAAKGYVGTLKDGAYYRLVCPLYDRVATEVDGNVQSIAVNEDNYAQYWKLVKNGTGYAIQNVVSQKYIQRQGTTSAVYQVGNTNVALYPSRNSDKWEYMWVISNDYNGGMGMHTANTQNYNVVRWNVTADASVWAFQEVNLTEEEIEAARGSQAEYNNLVNNISTYQNHLSALFEDLACTTLKDDIQALTDTQLAANADYAALNKDMQAMVLKVKNDTWQQYTNKTTGYTAGYEKFFRIADYQIYSHHQEMANGSNFTMSNAFGRLSGPTGIYANAGQIVYIYVGAAPKSECTLALEVVATDGVAGNHATGNQIALKQGLNVYMASQQVMLYIFHQLNNTQKYLADYPDITVHIEGGELNGYWDATRGMTDADWALLQQDLLKAPFLNLKTQHLVFQMDADLVKAAEPKNMEGLMRIWEAIPTNEDRYMGVEDFAGRYRNIWNAYSGASSYMHSTTHGTWYTESTLPTVMNYNNMRKAGNIWGPSHEIGHNHQGSINVIGTTESSNNLFSNINRFEQGIQTSRRQLPCDVFSDLAKGVPWLGRNIWNTTSMFFQLYLYFHAMHHDDNFYPNLFRTMRKNPINKGSWQTTTYVNGDGETVTGAAYVAQGSRDYLHLAKMICDVAQADLSEFFESYGMFVPVEKYYVGDYANYVVTTTQADIDEAKAYMKKYPKKLGNIMFIDDHILPMKDADPNNIFEGQPNSNGKRSNDTAQHDELGNGYPVGDVGDYEDFDGRSEYNVTGDYFTISGSTITFKGSGYVGHKFYDLNGNLIWATNAKSVTLPTALRTLGVDNYIVVAAEPNMEDVPCPYFKSGTAQVYREEIYFGNEEEHKTWWAGTKTNLSDYLPENAIGVIGSNNATENITSTPNIIAQDGTATSLVLNGDLPAYIPQDVEAGSVTFKKTISGVAALNLPFDVTSSDIASLRTASYENEVLSVTNAESVTAGKPVVVSGNVNLNLKDVSVKTGSYQELSAVKVLASDGQSIVEVETASPFTFNMGDATGIHSIDNAPSATGHAIYDLSGRRLERITKAGIYIVDGKKQVVKH